MLDLQSHLAARIMLLHGDWVAKNSAYDDDICAALEMRHETCRYWDARWKDYFIEFKKGKSIWIDLVRYGEVILKANTQACQETVPLFFIPNPVRDKIEEVVGVKTEVLVAKMGLTEQDAKVLLDLAKKVPHSLNAQASLTVTDIQRLKAFSVRE